MELADVEVGDAEVDISYQYRAITFMMRAQYKGLLGTVQDSLSSTHTDHRGGKADSYGLEKSDRFFSSF